MKIIEPSFAIESLLDREQILKHIERAGRTCYKSEGKIGDDTAPAFVRSLVKRGHESVLEHVSLSVRVVCDRGVSHEIVRHRIASYCLTGDTLIRSINQKSWSLRNLYEWQTDDKRKGRLQLMRIRSIDEETRTVFPNHIEEVIFNGTKPVYSMQTESGRSIRCTGNHRFYTPEGYVELRDLHVGDSIYALCSRCHKLWHKPGAIGLFTDRISSIAPAGEEDVFDLTVAGVYPNFVANGLVVHNSQESTRYCNYADGKFEGQVSFIRPCFWQEDTPEALEKMRLWTASMLAAETAYRALLEQGATPQEARSVLPNSLRTEIVMTMDLREWRHFFRLRCDRASHPQMREIAIPMLAEFRRLLPEVFEDLGETFAY